MREIEINLGTGIVRCLATPGRKTDGKDWLMEAFIGVTTFALGLFFGLSIGLAI